MHLEQAYFHPNLKTMGSFCNTITHKKETIVRKYYYFIGHGHSLEYSFLFLIIPDSFVFICLFSPVELSLLIHKTQVDLAFVYAT